LNIEQIAIERVIPYARNPRRNERAIALVAASIKEFGFRQPIVVDSEFVIIAGHTRWEAAQTLEMAEVPVYRALNLTPHQVKAFRIADNKLAEEATWNLDLLREELQALHSADYDMAMTAMTWTEIDKLLADTEGNLVDPSLAENVGQRKSAHDNPVLSIDKFGIPMTQPEFASLKKWIDDFVQTTGSVDGLFTALLDVNDVMKEDVA
jgi:ParB-like chromosome segregation protein Spo0J